MIEKYVTITGFKNYYGLRPFRVGGLIFCRKTPDNEYDADAIECTLPFVGTVGYIANGAETVAGGTLSAGRIYDTVPENFCVRVMFTSFSKVICKVENSITDAIENEIKAQLAKKLADLPYDTEEGEPIF